jgi:hypothetical protein
MRQAKQNSRGSQLRTTNENPIRKRMNQRDGYERRVKREKARNLNVIKNYFFFKFRKRWRREHE